MGDPCSNGSRVLYIVLCISIFGKGMNPSPHSSQGYTAVNISGIVIVFPQNKGMLTQYCIVCSVLLHHLFEIVLLLDLISSFESVGIYFVLPAIFTAFFLVILAHFTLSPHYIISCWTRYVLNVTSFQNFDHHCSLQIDIVCCLLVVTTTQETFSMVCGRILSKLSFLKNFTPN